MWVAKIAKFTKTAKFTIICKTCDEIHEIYSKGFREGPEKATRIAKTAKFTKTVKFTIICNTTYKIFKIYEGCENCQILRKLRNLR